MSIAVTISEQDMDRLLAATGTTNRDEAVNRAVATYLALDAQRTLLAFKGRVDILSNDEIEGCLQS